MNQTASLYNQKKPGYRFAVFATLFALLVIVLGAFTRLVDAGLGCPDWPGCYGHILWPMAEEEVIKANEKFPETPVEHDKTWPEQVHRLLAGSLGFFCIIFVVIAYIQRYKEKDKSYPLKLPILLLIVVIIQGIFGWKTVSLKLWPQVVTAHLLGGFATVSLLALLALRLRNNFWHVSAHQLLQLKKIQPLLLIMLLLAIIQIALGGWMTSNYAALACPDLPKCQTSWWPEMDFSQGFNIFQDIGPNYLGGIMDSASRTAIHITHRIGAIILTLFVIFTALLLMKIGDPLVKRWALVLKTVLLLQLLLGISNIVFALPLAVAVAHNAVGAIFLLTMVAVNYFTFNAKVYR